MKKYIVLSSVMLASVAYSQDNLVNSLKNNQSANANFTFTTIQEVNRTPVKNQGSTGTCWSYAGNSFLESEMIRMGKEPLDLAELFTARNTYYEKAKSYILYNGAISLGEGGEFHDVMNMISAYGAMPQEAYTGLRPGQTINSFGTLEKDLKTMLDEYLKNPSILSKVNWTQSVAGKLDSVIGKIPEKFIYRGKSYTPKSFAKEVVGIIPEDYANFSSYKDYKYYQPFVVPIPDNWKHESAWNVPMADLTKIIDAALKNGYSVGWATDVSEPYFSYKNGVAYVPDIDLDSITPDQKKDLFIGPKKDKTITEDMRQEALNNLSTTDDHGMHIVGIARDQTGKEYYKVKNSWGTGNDFAGYLYVSKPYVQYKTTVLVVHKNAVPKEIKNKLIYPAKL